jgi:fucose 4-O-acetylase-like acetyltransferase
MRRIWFKAKNMAEKTPATRNRSADFLRAVSILVVVLGHWLLAAPWVDSSGAHLDHLLARSQWTHWLTWFFQVMPIFFFVGGFSNGITWDAACRNRKKYSEWLGTRLARLLLPVLLLLVFWTVTASIAHLARVPAEMIRIGSQVALIPTWFLAVYCLMVILTPPARWAWKRWGASTIWVLVTLSVIGDLAYFQWDFRILGWTNYLFIWLAVHQLGFVWLDRTCDTRAKAWTFCAGGFLLLLGMTVWGPWPRSLVGVPGGEISNTTPPHLPLLALAAFQFGAVILLENRINRFLQNARVWTATVLVNGVIMTVFLWHSTAMMLLFGLAILLGGVGLGSNPGGLDWWMMRLPWLIVFLASLLPFVAMFARFERTVSPDRSFPAAWRLVSGTFIACSGLALLAFHGIGGEGFLGLRTEALLLPFLGLGIAGLLAWNPSRIPNPT